VAGATRGTKQELGNDKPVPVPKWRAAAPAGVRPRSTAAFLYRHHGRPFWGCPAPPRPPHLVFILRHHQQTAVELRPAHARRRRPPHPGTSSCEVSSLSLCDFSDLGLATHEGSLFVCKSAPNTPEDGRPTRPCRSRVLYVICSGGHSILGTSPCARKSCQSLRIFRPRLCHPQDFPLRLLKRPVHRFGLSGRVHAPLRLPRSLR